MVLGLVWVPIGFLVLGGIWIWVDSGLVLSLILGLGGIYVWVLGLVLDFSFSVWVLVLVLGLNLGLSVSQLLNDKKFG